ncbi:MAG TPA: HNH endonuclease [Chitinophagaceae bacterium]|nr:HNH endonuclease [Chitinophagaceae bacterium]
MDLPLSITTSARGLYEDKSTDSNFILYKYRGTDPYHGDNRRLREVFKRNLPLVYFYSIRKGRFGATWLVYIQNDSIADLTFTVAVDDITFVKKVKEDIQDLDIGRRSYLTAQTKVRLHQQEFRENVLTAYHCQYALCRLKHEELLDAAHIIPDKEELGHPIVQNGLALCKIHHAAFDKNIMGIAPDYSIHVNKKVLKEIDGPMLKHGIQFFDKQELILPKKKELFPDKKRLEIRFDQFLKAG